MQTFDVLIVGGGMVGLALAAALEDSGLRIAIVERTSTIQQASTDSAQRVSAINAASEQLLQQVGVWPHILALGANRYREMEVWDCDSFGHINFLAADYGYHHLGYIVENRMIQQALWHKVKRQRNVTIWSPCIPQQVMWGENEVFITLDTGQRVTARLVVAADGAHSWLRQQADIPLTFWDYGHHALVATVSTQLPHQDCARQVFHHQGILGFLPLMDPHHCAIVWSIVPQEAERLKTVSAAAFNRELVVTFDARLGLCEVQSERHVFPLMGRYARDFAGHRLALVGDAAHTVHPLAGQGVNLGFMDAAMLACEIHRLQQQGKDIGHYLYLRRYERTRKQSVALMLVAMQGLCKLFAGDHPTKKWLRGTGLQLANHLPGVKPYLIRRAMGLADMPSELLDTP